jgi:NAD+ diphosphatase
MQPCQSGRIATIMDSDYPLNVFRHCPACGSTECGSRTIKQFVCRACGFHYFQNAAAAVIALICNTQGQTLFTRRAKEPARGKLDLPGGFVDPLETAETAVAREVLEETGLVVTATRFLATFTNRYEYRGVTYYTLDLVFVCTVPDLSPLGVRDEEVTETLFLAPSEVASDEISFESARHALRALLAERANL